jgi:hypothetical protein
VTSWSFLAKFGLWSAAAFTLWSLALAGWYVHLIAAIGPHVSALIGARPEIQGSGRATQVLFQTASGPVGLHLETAALGLLPFYALLGATGWQTPLQRLAEAAVGTVVFVVFHLTLFIAYPFFLNHSGVVVDSLGAFWAILGYCGFPFLLWLVVLRFGGQRPQPA